MKKNLFLFLLIPIFLEAQINRSATELAKENVQNYLTTKLFKNKTYKVIDYGKLTERKDDADGTVWTMKHEFVITEVQDQSDNKVAVQKLYKFIFYFDDKMKIVRAESYF